MNSSTKSFAQQNWVCWHWWESVGLSTHGKKHVFFAAMFAISWWSLAAWNAEDTKSPRCRRTVSSLTWWEQVIISTTLSQNSSSSMVRTLYYHIPSCSQWPTVYTVYIHMHMYIYTHIFMSWIYILYCEHIYIINICLHTHNHIIDVGIHTISNVSFIHVRQS